MKFKPFQILKSTFLSLSLLFATQQPVHAAPGTLANTPLFVVAPVQPNIFFMLDDSGSMLWNLWPAGSSPFTINYYWYDASPTGTEEWVTWCLGANASAYNQNLTYTPWAVNMPNTATPTPYPNQTDLTSVWSEPTTKGVGSIYSTADLEVDNNNTGSIDLSSAPIVQWNDADGDGAYDAGECPVSYGATAVRADSLTTAQQINFANWFTYYRNRDRTVKSAVLQVIAGSSARLGMATLHANNSVGTAIADMTVTANKATLLEDITNIVPSGGTPLRQRLNWVGEYFDKSALTPTPSGLNIGAASSPILDKTNGGECQQNFVMLMTDGERNGGASGVGADQDTDETEEFVYPAHNGNEDENETLADVAMRWYNTDLDAVNLDDLVPIQTGANTQNLDENKKQHLVTFTVAFGLSDSLSDPVDRTAEFVWPLDSLADLRHAAYNGRGQFLSAERPEELTQALQDVISEIESRRGSSAAVTFSGNTLAGGTSLFFPSFNSEGWTGNVQSLTIDTTTGEVNTISSWDAASLLDDIENDEIANRVIYTWGKTSATAENGVLLNWSLTDPQPIANIVDDFKRNQDTTVDVAPFSSSQTRLNYIRGNTSNDSDNNYRNRVSRLGDIAHSSPQYVGKPNSNWPDTSIFGVTADKYSTYQTEQETSVRDAVVYVGANDGLLHGFDVATGNEVLAYLPSSPASTAENSGFHYLTEPDYQHQYYVDGSPVAADVYIKTDTAGSRDWRTIIVGALGGGGKGLYALNVTDPDNFSNTEASAQDVVLWEFSSDDDNDLGYTYSKPQITMMNNGEWAVIVGNGYNASGTNKAKLFIIFIEEGIDGEWATVGDYIKIDTGAGSGPDSNGLSSPTLVDLDNNGTTDRVYAGDLLGNMWAFDLSSEDINDLSTGNRNWKVAYQDGSSNPAPLFKATHHAGSPAVQQSALGQPITMKPLVIKPHIDWLPDSSGNQPNLMIYFGTGQYIAVGDATNINQQSFYGVRDAFSSSLDMTNMVEQTFETGFPIDARVLTTNAVDLQTQHGWFINLPLAGERVTVDAFELEGLIFFNTLTPSSSACSAGGSSWRMAVDMQTGGNPSIIAFDVNGDRVLDENDKVSDGSNTSFAAGVMFGYGIASATSVITNADGISFGYISGTDSASVQLVDLPLAPNTTGSRMSWIQLFN